MIINMWEKIHQCSGYSLCQCELVLIIIRTKICTQWKMYGISGEKCE